MNRSMTQTESAPLPPHPLLFALQRLVVDLALVDRNHHLPGLMRAENDIEHSFTVAMLCWFIRDTYSIPLDLEKLLTYALVHDFVERYAGDTNTYASQQARAKKAEREEAALVRLSEEFKDFDNLANTMAGYEAKRDEEALFVWTVDKMQAMILGDLDNWRPYQKVGISYVRFAEKSAELLAAGSPYCREIFQGLIEYSKTTYYDRPEPELP